MNRFNEVAQTVLKEELNEKISKVGEYYEKVINTLKEKGLMSHDIIPVLDAVKQAYMAGYQEGKKAVELNPFR